jgi:cell division protein FtsB
MGFFGVVGKSRDRRLYLGAPALLFGGVCLAWPGAALAEDTAEELKQLRASIQKELADLKKREQKLHQEFLRLDQKSQLLDDQLRKLRAAGAVPGAAASATPVGGAGPPAAASARPAGTEVAQTAPSPPAAAPEPEGNAPAAAPPPAGGESAPITGPSAEEQQARQVVETAPTLSSVGGVLTPKGQIVIDPSIEYDYWAQNQLGVNGFQIIPGITFGNIFVTRFEQNITTAAVTVRGGVTDRLELNAKIPYVYNTGSTNTLIPVGANAQLLAVNANGSGIGDVQAGGSYQINSGENGWPIFVGNFLFKTVTGRSPFQVPIVTQSDPNMTIGQFLAGTPRELATGTGFYQITPSLTVLLPTAPGVLFANLQWQHNLARTQPIQDRQGGPPTPVNLQPGEAPAITFGIGFALNDRSALTLSYQQTHVFPAYANGQEITGSPYSFGTFNFGLGYQISQSTRLNLSVGIGAGPNTPAAKVLLEIPYRFSL